MTENNLKATLEGHTDRVWQLAWQPSGKLLASCSGDKTIRLWGIDSNSEWVCTGILEGAHERTIRSIGWSPDNSKLASGSFDGTVCIWSNEEDGEWDCIATLEGHENEVKSVAWDDSGSLLATCGRDKTVWIWEVQEGNEFECIAVLYGHSGDVKCVKWMPDREVLLSASYDDTIRVWAEGSMDYECAETLIGHQSTIWDLAFDEKGTWMASCSDDKTVILWKNVDVQNAHKVDGKSRWKKMSVLEGDHKRTIFSVDWAKTSERIVTGASDNAIRVFQPNVENGSAENPSFEMTVEMKKAHDTDINCVVWHPSKDGVLASCSDDGCVKVWEIPY